MSFPAIHALDTLRPGHRGARPHGHDFTAAFVFEAATLIHPGVVVDDDMRAEISHYVDNRLAHRDLNALFGHDQLPTCENIAAHLAAWHHRSARISGHAHLRTVIVTTGSGGHGEIHLPHPAGLDERS